MPLTVRVTDITQCTDVAVEGAPNTVVNGLLDHRLTDGTGGHGCWPPNQSDSGSPNVIVEGLPTSRIIIDEHIGHACIAFHQTQYITGSPDTIVN